MDTVLHEKNSRLLQINSTDRALESVSQYDLVYHTNDRDLHQISKIILKSAMIPNTMYNINEFNSVFTFPTSLAGTSLFPIIQGQYTTTSLIATLKSEIDIVIQPDSVTITQDPLTEKLTFGLSSGTFDLVTFEQGNLMANVLGIKESGTNLGFSTRASALPNLSGLKQVFVSSKTLTNHTPMISSEKLKNSIWGSIPITVAYGETQVHEENSTGLDYCIYSNHKNISTLDLELLDENGNTLDLNGSDWNMILRVYE